MSDLVVQIPDDVYSRLQAMADVHAQSVEEALVDYLKTSLPPADLPPDEATELAALRQLSDDALWTIAREQMPSDVQERMQILMDRNSLGQITPEEYREMEEINERGDRLIVRKAEAAAILKERNA